MLIKKLEEMRSEILEQLKAVQATDPSEKMQVMEQIRVQWLGKKSPLNDAMKELRYASDDVRKSVGLLSNEIRQSITSVLEETKAAYDAYLLEKQLEIESIDVTLPGRQQKIGTTHLLTRVLDEIEDLFTHMGYQVVEGYEVETDDYNFGKMNLPKDHPARDMQDTFYINPEILLRTQTSPVQARTMEAHDFTKGPLKMISPGKVYRRDDDDATHSHQFQQVEGLVVAENVTMSDLKGTLEVVARQMFGQDRTIRLRPSYFPFTEPSVEVDVSCFKCQGNGCSVCKQIGWIEVLGAGMVHPNVLEMSGVDSTKYSGFAFGLGVERFAMLKYGVDDIRHFYQNDLKFLNQFSVIMEDKK